MTLKTPHMCKNFRYSGNFYTYTYEDGQLVDTDAHQATTLLNEFVKKMIWFKMNRAEFGTLLRATPAVGFADRHNELIGRPTLGGIFKL